MRACASEMHMDTSQELFCMEIFRTMPDANPVHGILREPAQAKRAWTFHMSHSVWKFTGKMPDANPGATIFCERAQSKCTWTFHKSNFVSEFKGKMPDAPATISIQHRALTVTVRTPQCGHTVWGNHGVYAVFFHR